MPITRSQLEAATEALQLALKFDRPADSVIHDFFAARRALGSHDRAFVAEAVYGVLRRKRTVDHLAPGGTPRSMLLAYLVRIGGVSVRELTKVTKGSGLALTYANARPDPDSDSSIRGTAAVTKHDEQSWLARVKAEPLDGLPLAARAELPDWVVERLGRHHSESTTGSGLALTYANARPDPSGEAEILALARGLNEPAPLDLRVNTLRAERDGVLRALAADGIEAAPTPYSPVGVRVRSHPAINRHPLFVSGAIEVQDESSQLSCYLVAPKRHEMVVDFCAGAGGKSLMLGALMRSQGRLYAFDVSAERLSRLKPRLKRSGLSNLYAQRIKNENDLRIKRLAGKIDRVLVDAPCSGLGTLRRNPDLKWRQSPRSVEELKVKQAAILRSAASLVKPGGRLVYATCSLLAEENEQIVEAFQSAQPEFRLLHCGELLREARIELETGAFLRLLPHLHGTDGFFAAAMKRSQ
ncbi:MAG: RsmB/NOP family class I SAM-dependent RNA methyltransferase [Betaproteobacteria bacterium]|nr:RsmB/NOP family class I SAM-dependent RNA methyltransferase [Betaproteobacteria bacterium]